MITNLRKALCVTIVISLGMVGFSQSMAIPHSSGNDTNFGGTPISLNQEQSVYFKEEFVNITLTSSRAYVNAFYTFKNKEVNPIEMILLLPFMDCSSSGSEQAIAPEDHVRILNDGNFTYEWVNISLEEITWVLYCNYKAIEFQLAFSSYEEKGVWINYSRNYCVNIEGDIIIQRETYYEVC